MKWNETARWLVARLSGEEKWTKWFNICLLVFGTQMGCADINSVVTFGPIFLHLAGEEREKTVARSKGSAQRKWHRCRGQACLDAHKPNRDLLCLHLTSKRVIARDYCRGKLKWAGPSQSLAIWLLRPNSKSWYSLWSQCLWFSPCMTALMEGWPASLPSVDTLSSPFGCSNTLPMLGFSQPYTPGSSWGAKTSASRHPMLLRT